MTRTRWALALAILLTLAGASSAAAAPDTTVDFERVPAGTTVTTQYVSPEGVEFGDPRTFGLPAFSHNCGVTSQNGGISGRSGQVACEFGGEGDVTNQVLFDAAFEFRETRRKVGFQIRNTAPEASIRSSAVVQFYGPGAVLLNQQTVSFPSAGTTRDVSWQIAGTTRIAAVRLIANDAVENVAGNVPPVYIDNIYATKDDVPPSPEFALALATPSISVYEGGTGNATVSIRRFNGSTGAVTLSVPGGLPAGIAGVQFLPNPVTGRDPVTMRVSASSPFSDSRQLTVRATGGSPDAGSSATGDLTQTVVGSPVVAIGNRETASLVRGCGPQNVRDEFTVRGGYSGTVGIGLTGGATGPAIFSVATPTVTVNGNGSYPFTLRIDPDGGPSSAQSGGTYNASITPTGATAVAAARSYTIAEMRADSATGPSGTPITRPLNAPYAPSAYVTGDFPSQCEIAFVDQHGVTWPTVDRHTVEVGGRARDQVTLQVPLLATSGPLNVQSVATGRTLTRTPPVDIVDYRNTHGSQAANAGPNAGAPDYTWEDFRRTFGDDDVDRCFLGMCGRSPIAEGYHDMYRDMVRSYNGLCAGFSFMSMRFSGYKGTVQRPSTYEPGRTRAYQIADVTDGTLWKRDIVRWHVAQNDADFGRARNEALARSAPAELALLRGVIAAHSVAYISIRTFDPADKSLSGHAVVAYAIQENVSAQMGEVAPVTLVRIYDPNLPYAAADETTPNAATAAADAATFTNLRTLRIDATGAWSGANFPWSGQNNTLGVIDAIPGQNATLPSRSSLFFFSTDMSAGAPVPVSIKANGKQALGKDGRARAGSGVTIEPSDSGVKAETHYGLAPGRSYELSLRGTRRGRYIQGQYAKSAVATVEAPTTAGQVDRLTVTPRSSALSFSTGATRARVTYGLATHAGKADRGARIALTATKGRKDRASLSGGAVELRHAGAATSASLTLTSVGEGVPSTVTTAPLRVGAGQRLQVRPTQWSDLGAGARYTVRSAGGRVIRQGAVRLRPSTTVAMTTVRARRKKGVVTISGRIRKAGRSPRLAAEVVFRRGGKVVARKGGTLRGSAAKRGSFRLRIKVAGVPKRAKGRVTVTLGDEATTTAGARRTAPVTA